MSDSQYLRKLLDELGEGEGDLDFYLAPISDVLRDSSKNLAALKQLFLEETSPARKNDILMAFDHYASAEIEHYVHIGGSEWERCRYEFLFDGNQLCIHIQDVNCSHWQQLLDILRYGDEPYRFSLNSKVAPLPEDAALLFKDYAGQGPTLTIDVSATLIGQFKTGDEIVLSLDSHQSFEIAPLFEFLAYLGVLLDRPVRLASEKQLENPICEFSPGENRFAYIPANYQAPVGEGVATCPQLRAENLIIDGPLRTWADLVQYLRWDVSLVVGERVLLFVSIAAIDLVWEMERWQKNGLFEGEPFAYADLIRFSLEGEQWRIESGQIETDAAPVVTHLQLQWCVETFIANVLESAKEATGHRLSLLFKGFEEPGDLL